LYTSPQPEKLDYLLGLRGLAALGVVLGHCFAIGGYSIGVYVSSSASSFYAIIDHPLDAVRAALFIATPILGTNFVILFFVQSGYLMGKVFHDRKYEPSSTSILKFYRNRYFRLAPLLYFNLLVAICFFSSANLSPMEFIGDLAFITNFTDRGINLVTWSLSHEMQYYLIAPFVFRLFRAPTWFSLLKLAATVAVIYLITRRGFFSHFEYLYSFLVGYAVNLAIRMWPMRVHERTKIASAIFGVIAIDLGYNFLYLHGHDRLGGLAVALVSAMMVFAVECPSHHEISRAHPAVARIVGWAAFTGTLSYGIYLWHYMVIVSRYPLFERVADVATARFGWQALWLKIAVYHFFELSFTLVATYLIATITFYLIEVRFRPGLYARSNEVAATRTLEEQAT
jgi:peptidoglycan/LPS O-acetylase OafA/YrhL